MASPREHQDPMRLPAVMGPIEAEMMRAHEHGVKSMLVDVTKLMVAQKNRIEKGVRANIGEVRVWGGKKFQKQPDKSWIPVGDYASRLDDFMYSLNSDYVVDFAKKEKRVFRRFFDNCPRQITDNFCVLKTIGYLSSNLPEPLVADLSMVRLNLVGKATYERESGGYWVGAYDERLNHINLNRDVYDDVAGDWYGQEQFTKVILHEYGHRLYRGGDVDSETLFELWATGERVSKQAKYDYEENFAEAFAAYMMALGTEGATDGNRDYADFAADFSRSAEIMSRAINGIYES